jgi:hypothetical protein
MRGGRLVQSTATPDWAKLLERAITNHQRVKALLVEWKQLNEAETLMSGTRAGPAKAFTH